MLKYVVLALFYASLGNASPSKPHYDIAKAQDHFTEFTKNFNKSYKTEAEYGNRYRIFVNNLITINHLNKEYENVTFDVNRFADMQLEELTDMRTKPSQSEFISQESLRDELKGLKDLEMIDWRNNNSVTDIRDQGDCWSGWAFSATAVLESQYGIKYNKLLDLSEQQLLDCDNMDDACSSGLPLTALEYLSAVGGQMLESDYKYKANYSSCKFNSKEVAVKVKRVYSYKTLRPNDNTIAKLVAYRGPVAVEVKVTDSFRFYKSGILSPKDCLTYIPFTHSIIAVGYDKDASGKYYWIFKNSWGTSFGEHGYMRFAWGARYCAIGSSIVYAKIE